MDVNESVKLLIKIIMITTYAMDFNIVVMGIVWYGKLKLVKVKIW